MTSSSASGTSPSLLEKVRQFPPDERAWGEFVDRYAPRIYAWCRRWRLQEADAREVTQIVLAKLVEKLRSFRYDPARSFRAWLKTVTHHAWQDYADARRRSPPSAGGSWGDEALHSVEARDDLVGHLEAEFDRELLDQAIAEVRARVEERTWDAFRLTALDGRPGKQVADDLHMPITAVYMAKSRVQGMLKDALARLEAQGPGDAGV
jgi:RNA polymerase sigma factor (sigma-70 family)